MSKNKTKSTEDKQKKGFGAFLKDEKFKITAGLILIFLAALLTIAFISYLFPWNLDQSKEWKSIFSGSTEQVDNWSGKTGAKLADLFINKGIGVTAFGIPFLFFIIDAIPCRRLQESWFGGRASFCGPVGSFG